MTKLEERGEKSECDRFRNTRIIAFPDDSRLIAARFQMAVDTVIADIQNAIFEPFNVEI